MTSGKVVCTYYFTNSRSCGQRYDRVKTGLWVSVGFASFLFTGRPGDVQLVHLPGGKQLLRAMVAGGFQFLHQERTAVNPAHQTVSCHRRH